ncbi:MAG: hypothetical protein DI539_04145 [Flavobacterium psychrophilum]|nr:MAG: hypothetical protein DI539_04145 [Flavobacterium psychrophilum]
MKKLIMLSAMAFILFSCDGILKDRSNDGTDAISDKKVVLGTDKDEHGCVHSAGYRWSKLKEECIRVFEEGYRLNLIDELKGESMNKSAFVVFEEDGDRAELFLPDNDEAIMLERAKEGTPYVGSDWSLELQKKYSLKKNGRLLYAGAEILEGQITGDDKAETY